MSSLTLKKLPPKLLRSLQSAAAHHRRTAVEQAIYLLDLALHHRIGHSTWAQMDVESQVAAWRELAGRWRSDIEPEHEAQILRSTRCDAARCDTRPSHER